MISVLKRGGRLAILAAAVLAVTVSGCERPFAKKTPAGEITAADWKLLRETVDQYKATRLSPDPQDLLFLQTKFTEIASVHSGNKIGDEAFYYIGRIYYDIRAYSDARSAFAKHKEYYPRSFFRETIEKLEVEMDRDIERYNEWLKQSREAAQ